MDAENKRLAEAVISHLCLGRYVSGIRFGAILQLLLDPSRDASIKGQVYVNLASNWTVLESPPSGSTDLEADCPEMSIDEQMHTLYQLRGLKITDTGLGQDAPHLSLRLENGNTILINGLHHTYESWVLGMPVSESGEFWMVVAAPGGGLAVWAPDQFRQQV